MNVFVIGGDGFIGSHVCRQFLGQGHQVTVFGPSMDVNLLKDIEHMVKRIEGDILDLNCITQAIKNAKAEVVIHLAAFGAGKDGLAKGAQKSPKQAIDVNIMGFYNVLESVKEAGVSKLLWSSSTTVYGPAQHYWEAKVNESSAMNPVTFYGSTKVMDELMARYYRSEHGMNVVGIRLPLIFGPGRWYKGAGAAIVDLFEQANSDQEIVINGGSEEIDLMYVKDAARVFVQAALTNKSLTEVYNVKSDTTTIKAMVDTVNNIVPESNIRFEPLESITIYPLIDTTRVEEELGFIPEFTIDKACQDYLNEIRRNQGD